MLSVVVARPSFAKRFRSPEIPGLALAGHPGMTEPKFKSSFKSSRHSIRVVIPGHAAGVNPESRGWAEPAQLRFVALGPRAVDARGRRPGVIRKARDCERFRGLALAGHPGMTERNSSRHSNQVVIQFNSSFRGMPQA
jgi:hypothetical protein